MGQKKSEFDKVFSAWDILVIAFGAMIGWAGLYLPEHGSMPVVLSEQHLPLQSVVS
mgnify:CR=1 FL=1